MAKLTLAEKTKKKLEDKIKQLRSDQKIESDYIEASAIALSKDLSIPISQGGGEAKYSLIWLKKSIQNIEDLYVKELAARDELYKL